MLTRTDHNLLHTLDQSGHAHCREARRLIERLAAVAGLQRDQIEALTHERKYLVAQADSIRAKLNEFIALTPPKPQHIPLPLCTLFLFNPDSVHINHKRFSVAQGEVELFYNGERLGQFGDNIKLIDGQWRGHPDDYWIDVARLVLAKREVA